MPVSPAPFAPASVLLDPAHIADHDRAGVVGHGQVGDLAGDLMVHVP
jgi:hypothetical protein